MAGNEPIDKNLLDIMLVRHWMAAEIAKARDLNLPMFHVGWESVVQGITLMAPSFTVDQTRETISALIIEWTSKLRTALEPAQTEAKAAPPQSSASVLRFPETDPTKLN